MQMNKALSGASGRAASVAPIVLLPVLPACRHAVSTKAQKTGQVSEARRPAQATDRKGGILQNGGVELGPIGMTIGGADRPHSHHSNGVSDVLQNGGVELGPIGMTVGGADRIHTQPDLPVEKLSSIHSMTTEQWEAKYMKADGTVDLWMEEEFNAGSRLVGGRAVHKGGVAGMHTGEGPTEGLVPTHKVQIHDHYSNQVFNVEVPEDRYILYEAEDKGMQLPYACRMGCCTACAVRVKEGTLWQPEALGISAELKEQGYALMCVGYPTSDLVLETVSEDEVYELQFGASFSERALNPANPDSVERDDYALEIANMDE